MGYSNDMLWHDPNLAEGLPVRDSLFVVNKGEAHLLADPPVSLNSRPDWLDRAYTLRNGIASTNGFSGNARLTWKVNVSPYRCYHISAKVRTQQFTGEPEIKPLADGKPLSYSKIKVKPTQDWTEHHVVFDSLENNSVSIYMGVWGDSVGTLQWKDWKIEEVGLLNVLRRDGTPCVVQGLTEGKDYQPIKDPLMGNQPWSGQYEIWHQPPAIKTPLPDGTRLRVSWYFPAVINDEQVAICPSEPKTMQLLADEAKRVNQAFAPAGLMMSHDEFRVLNQDKSCLDRHLTPGQILADNVRQCTQLLQGRDVYAWSDMFDPYHNAVDSYYLVNGSYSGSWEGLDKRVTIMNWNFGKRNQSLRFFADRGHRQIIAGYYDGDVRNINQWLDSARDVPNITGIMYTTWRHDFSNLQRFAEMVRASSTPAAK